MNKHISDNKHEFNLRRVDELASELTLLEKDLENTNGFFNRLKVKKKIKKVNKQIDTHANEISFYEQQKLINN